MTITDVPAPPRAGLPRIEPYVLPTAADLPPRRVDWRVDPARAVLLVHDMQRYFTDAYVPDDEGQRPTDRAATRINDLRGRFRAHGAPIVYTAQPGDQAPADRALLHDFWGAGLRDDGEQPAIIDLLAPGDGDVVLTKWRYSAFARTPLRDLMSEWGRDQLVITGIYAHIGCQTTATDAFMQDVQAFLVADATADFTAADHHAALSYVARRSGVVTTTAEVLGEIGRVHLGREAVRHQLAAIVDDDPAALTDDVEIIDSGLDSVRVMTLVNQWAEAGIVVELEDLLVRTTVGEWCTLISGG